MQGNMRKNRWIFQDLSPESPCKSRDIFYMTTTDKDAVTLLDSHNDSESPASPAVDESVSYQRRKLIKATAAVVPAVMTLRSGAAAAMGSTYHCTNHDNKLAMLEITTASDFVLEVNSTTTHDHWIRVYGRRVQTKLQNTPVTVYCTETGSGKNADAWQCFDENGNPFSGNLSEQTILKGDEVALLAFLSFDQYGNDIATDPILYYPLIKTVTVAPPGYSPLTGSCLSSIHPNLVLPG